MIAVAWQTMRAHLSGLVGTFIALALGVTLLTMMALTLASTVGAGDGPTRWYTGADVVVAGANEASVTTGSGEDRETASVRTPEIRPLPADLPARLSTVDATVVVDHAGYAATAGAPGDTAHPWSAAGLHAYTWVAGGPPEARTDIVLSAPTAHRPGDRITVSTARGPMPFTVSGVVRSPAQAALYTVDGVAAELAGGKVSAIALTAKAGGSAAALAERVRAVVGGDGGVRVLVGAGRRGAEPYPDSQQLTETIALLAASCGMAGFVSIFVVAGTFTYAVAARRREFGLLRAAGATPRQVRWTVLVEALLVGTFAAGVGAAAGAALAPRFARWLVDSGFAPPTFTAHFIFWPVAAAFGSGLLVALTGVYLAARRAGLVRPIEALREAALDRRAMTPARWLVGLGAIAATLPILAVFPDAGSDNTVALAIVAAMFLITACAMFAPLFVPPLVWLLAAPFGALLGPIGVLAGHGARTAVRRTAATAAPILVTVGIAGSTMAAFATLATATDSAARERIAAEATVVPTAAEGIADSTVAALRTVPGVGAAVPVTETPVYVRESDEPKDWTGRYVHGPDLAAVFDLPVVAGSLADLTGTDTAAVPSGTWRLGETAELWLGDSTPVRLRVVAVLPEQLDLDETVLLPWALRDAHTRSLADAVYVRLAPGADPGPVAAVAAAGGGALIRTAQYLSAASARRDRTNRLGTIAVIGMALLYTGIAIANTLVMATRDRARELALLRLGGTTPGQVIRLIGVEAVLVTGVGALLATVVTAVTVLATRNGLSGAAPSVEVDAPWGQLGAIVLGCLVTALLASTIPAAFLLRHRPAGLVAARE
ncbi:ABC transporter permease [Virgisporangium aliadipatigenens]|uniref:ABC transporter permease n=1 Tax=Virgisporangium aliadipatigenens TaxID=741659 RepID=UPI001943CB1A|nr:FtsX-like permease family protein [Virgisporangium aliadipatigenens]